jgi:hypothetical protein
MPGKAQRDRGDVEAATERAPDLVGLEHAVNEYGEHRGAVSPVGDGAYRASA